MSGEVNASGVDGMCALSGPKKLGRSSVGGGVNAKFLAAFDSPLASWIILDELMVCWCIGIGSGESPRKCALVT